MNARDEKVKRVMAELDAHIAEVQASVALLKKLLADDKAPEEEDPS